MEQRNLSNLNPIRDIYNVIGSICQDTELLRHEDTKLKPDDFMQELHQIVFKAINNIVYNASGDKVTTVTAVDIDNYLSLYPTQYKKWNDQNGFEYIENCLKHANREVYWQSYNRVKKMSLLRAYVNRGFDVSELYDWETDDFLTREKSLKELDEMELKDIFQYFALVNLQVKDMYNIEMDIKEFKAGSDISGLLDRAREGRTYGFPTSCGFENSAFGGLQKGKFLLRSGSTGSLKTSLQIRDMIDVAVKSIYKDGEWVYNGVQMPSLFISTELDEDDLNFLALSYITGINRKVIKEGLFNMKQRELLEEAGKILNESELYMVHMPEFSVSDLEDVIERHVLDNNVQFVAFDYISNNSKLQRSMNELYNSVQREDQVLLYLSTSLKTISERYDISIQSATQLNRNGIGKESEMNSNALRGSSAVADKVDFGMILKRVKEEDLDKVSGIIEDRGFSKTPSFQRHLYKNRSGIPDIIMWTHIDSATIREECLFVTDYDYNLIEDVVDLQFEFKEGRTDKTIEDEKQYADGEKVFGDIDSQKEEIDF